MKLRLKHSLGAFGIDVAAGQVEDSESTPEEQGKDPGTILCSLIADLPLRIRQSGREDRFAIRLIFGL
jgi:hypothetical protein